MLQIRNKKILSESFKKSIHLQKLMLEGWGKKVLMKIERSQK